MRDAVEGLNGRSITVNKAQFRDSSCRGDGGFRGPRRDGGGYGGGSGSGGYGGRMEASFCKIKREQKADFDALKKAILDLSISSQGRSMETTDASSGNCKSQLELPKFVDDRDFHKSIDVDRAIADEDLMEQHSSESYEEMDIDLKIGVEDCIRVSTEIEDIEFLRSDTQHDEVIGGKMGKQFDIEVESAAMWQPRPIVHFELRFGVDARAVERSYFEDIDAGASSPAAASLPAYKKLRCSSSTSPVRFTYSPPVHTSSVDQLKDLFPELEIQLLEKALEESVNDLDLAIKKLHEFCRGHVNEKIDTTEENATMEKVASQTSGDSVPLQEPQTQNNLPADGAEWVDLFVREMMSATSIDDARFRAASILESLEKSISPRACAEAAQNSYKENLMLKEHIEVLLRDNAILKRGVAIQIQNVQQPRSGRRNPVSHEVITILSHLYLSFAHVLLLHQLRVFLARVC
ncbi:hypothetical protein SASPL_145224 [Salvia splendens]|uniref:CUE domain-containing protein n=1 Tax=Salvia splendens TaxID=180675 RepID=A0A8X8WG61_SALSN|nr:hypothetical protein SASPL_145224 [Salvia splendens]